MRCEDGILRIQPNEEIPEEVSAEPEPERLGRHSSAP